VTAVRVYLCAYREVTVSPQPFFLVAAGVNYTGLLRAYDPSSGSVDQYTSLGCVVSYAARCFQSAGRQLKVRDARYTSE
jgi:hypothetical protein